MERTAQLILLFCCTARLNLNAELSSKKLSFDLALNQTQVNASLAISRV
jgi:hypothetical protein